MYKWYLHDGTCITEKEAEVYLVHKMNVFRKLSKEIDNVINNCKSLNIIEEDESLSWSVMETSERLSLIQIQLEMLLDEIKCKL